MYNFVRKVIVAFVLAGCVASAVAAKNLPLHVEQIKKVSLAEKKQWAYVQQVLQLSKLQPKLDKMHVWMRSNPIVPKALACGCGYGFCLLMVLAAEKCGMENLNAKRIALSDLGLYGEASMYDIAMMVIVLAVAVGGISIGILLDDWLEQKPDAITTLQVFVAEWQKHREKFPSVLHTLFDNLHVQQKDNCDLPINDQQVVKFVQELATLAKAAQHS